MTDVNLRHASPGSLVLRGLWRREKPWLAVAAILLVLAVVAPAQAGASLRFVAGSLLDTAPYLLLSIAIAAYVTASGADALVARVFSGAPMTMIAVAALFGGLSPFCSCGVIPLIAALLAMGVPLSAVMAFWLASPVIDPSMFVLTAGLLGLDFAVAKMLAAVFLGLFGGYATHVLMRNGFLDAPLRKEVGNGGCCGASARTPKPVTWAFWRDPQGRARFAREGLSVTLFLFRWLTLAFLLESLMLVYVPQAWVAETLGGTGLWPVVLATLVGVPAYLNGYAALPLVSGLIGQGMDPGAGLSFLVAGGVTSIPAAIAVFALVRLPVFVLYLAFALAGSLASGLAYQAFLAG